MLVDLIAEPLRDRRHGEGVLHPTVVGVGRRKKVFVGVDGFIVVELVAQLFAELGK
jgi:hypothetical protein